MVVVCQKIARISLELKTGVFCLKDDCFLLLFLFFCLELPSQAHDLSLLVVLLHLEFQKLLLE